MYFMYTNFVCVIYCETIIIRPIDVAFLDTLYPFTLGFETGNARMVIFSQNPYLDIKYLYNLGYLHLSFFLSISLFHSQKVFPL